MERYPHSLNALRTFEAAARHKSFKLAANELRVTQSAVSRQIKRFEESLGVPLFHRSNRYIELTDAGEQLQTTVSQALTEIVKAIHRIARRKSSYGSELRLAVTPGIAECWLGPRLARFCLAHPEVQPEVSVADDTVSAILSGEVQVALYWGAGQWPHLHSEIIMDLSEFPVCSPRLLERIPLHDVAELSHHTLLHWKSRRWWRNWLRTTGQDHVDWRLGPVLDDYALYMEMAVGGDGIALTDELMAGDRLIAGQLVQPLATRVAHPSKIHLLMPSAQARSRIVMAFRTWLIDEISSFRSALTGENSGKRKAANGTMTKRKRLGLSKGR